MFSAQAATITTVKWTLKCIVGILIVIFIVFGVQAVENRSSEREDGGSPGQTVPPVKFVVYFQTDGLDELDGIQHQTAGLQNHCSKEHNCHRSVETSSGANAYRHESHQEGKEDKERSTQQQSECGNLPIGPQRAAAPPGLRSYGLPARLP